MTWLVPCESVGDAEPNLYRARSLTSPMVLTPGSRSCDTKIDQTPLTELVEVSAHGVGAVQGSDVGVVGDPVDDSVGEDLFFDSFVPPI